MIVIWVMVLQLMVFINLTSRVRGFWAGKKIPSSIFIPTFHTFFFSSLFLFLHFNFCLLFNVFFYLPEGLLLQNQELRNCMQRESY